MSLRGSAYQPVSEPEPPYEKKLEAALQHAGEWKAKAFKAQKAAVNFKQTATALKQRAQSAVVGQNQLRESLEQAQQVKDTALNRLAAAEQQLALYQTALTELNEGKQLAEIIEAIRSGEVDPDVEKRHADELKRCQEELEASQIQCEALKQDMWANRSVLENKIEKLETQNRQLSESLEEFHHSKTQQLADDAVRERDLESQLSEALLELKVQSKALRHAEQQLAIVENDSQLLIEELHSELESAREELGVINTEKIEREQELEAQLSRLQDANSDLEIVNGELYQRIAELEN